MPELINMADEDPRAKKQFRSVLTDIEKTEFSQEGLLDECVSGEVSSSYNCPTRNSKVLNQVSVVKY
jgi:hypothetical protein